MSNYVEEFCWIGSQENFADTPNIFQLNDDIMVGRYGGNSNVGQFKNEDGCLVWLNKKQDWEFAILLDSHNTSESAELILGQFTREKSKIKHVLSMPTNHQMFKRLEELILNMFQSEEFLSACRKVSGETACLIVARKDKFIWWFSVGDCVLYLFHRELAALGQYQLNQRQFYEWIGQINTFELDVPCYTLGMRELRKGENRLFLTTDGLLECPNEPYVNPMNIYHSFSHTKDEESIRFMLNKIKDNEVRDSTTIISWKVAISKEATKPSN
ncbi:protein phosphatase 2C domain-containing protein [Bacillus sp. FJAT-50079]|uniref:protein phosphatase 2C domain-containing protein n=1 Tax=Bacillus sp. FJAT-50079 TaxID=2833577 RepID=UPI001BC8CA03|nr:protein phosphatase 2C domain-containing protein [Bacillus sp. FJAT-50079]MBS4207345.1 protein phosphatase 2C domain-containing protein [Bacillus sp. FJAT-50079]